MSVVSVAKTKITAPKWIPLFFAPLLVLTACAETAVVEPEMTETTPTVTPEPLPTGDGELVLGSILSLSGDSRGAGRAALAGIELAIREINSVAKEELLGGVEGQINNALGKTISMHYRSNDASQKDPDTARATLQTFSEQGVDIVLAPGDFRLPSQLLSEVEQLGIPLVVPAKPARSFIDTSNGFVVSDGIESVSLAAEFFRLAIDEAAHRISYAYLPDESGNSMQRLLNGLSDEQLPRIEQKQDDTEVESGAENSESSAETLTPTIVPPKQGYEAFPLLFDPEEDIQPQLRDLAEQLVAFAPDSVAVYLPQSDQSLSRALLLELIDLGISPQNIVLLDENPVSIRNQPLDEGATEEEQATQAANDELLTGIKGVIANTALAENFSNRVRQVDPWTPVNLAGQQAYESVIRIQLARLLADDDNGQRIAEAYERVSTGAAQCYSYAECVHVLNTRDDIRYLGSAAHFAKLQQSEFLPIQVIEVQQDNSLTVLNGEL